jgi:5-methylcytosine-specific restriction endonuclease McrA
MPNVPDGKPPKWHAKIPGAEHVEWQYKTWKWVKYRIWFLKMHPLCAVCERPATVVDHIIPAKSKPQWFWRVSNHQPLCEVCHNKKRATSDKE